MPVNEPASSSSRAPGRTPLKGLRVLHGRPHAAGDALTDALEAAGASAIHVPLIDVGPPADVGPLSRARAALEDGRFDAVAITSANAARAVAGWQLPIGVEVAAVGPATAHALRAAGWRVDVTPPTPPFSAAALAAAWRPAAGSRVLLPCSDRAGTTLLDTLRARGCRVEPVIAYRTKLCPPPAEVARDLGAGAIDVVLCTSPSTVQALAGYDIAPSVRLIAIGEPTAAAARAAGREVAAIAHTASDEGLVAALIELNRPKPRGKTRETP